MGDFRIRAQPIRRQVWTWETCGHEPDKVILRHIPYGSNSILVTLHGYEYFLNQQFKSFIYWRLLWHIVLGMDIANILTELTIVTVRNYSNCRYFSECSNITNSKKTYLKMLMHPALPLSGQHLSPSGWPLAGITNSCDHSMSSSGRLSRQSRALIHLGPNITVLNLRGPLLFSSQETSLQNPYHHHNRPYFVITI